MFGYTVIRNSVETDTYSLLLELGEQMDFPLEALHEETGPGVIVAAIGCDRVLESTDWAVKCDSIALCIT